MTIDQRNSIISLFLSIVIIGLSYVLYDSIVTPYQTRLDEIETETRVRERMTSIRDALIAYQRENGKYPPSLDSIQVFLERDADMIAMRRSTRPSTWPRSCFPHAATPASNTRSTIRFVR
jgi:type II secretory pathway pseudopilin PulG